MSFLVNVVTLVFKQAVHTYICHKSLHGKLYNFIRAKFHHITSSHIFVVYDQRLSLCLIFLQSFVCWFKKIFCLLWISKLITRRKIACYMRTSVCISCSELIKVHVLCMAEPVHTHIYLIFVCLFFFVLCWEN